MCIERSSLCKCMCRLGTMIAKSRKKIGHSTVYTKGLCNCNLVMRFRHITVKLTPALRTPRYYGQELKSRRIRITENNSRYYRLFLLRTLKSWRCPLLWELIVLRGQSAIILKGPLCVSSCVNWGQWLHNPIKNLTTNTIIIFWFIRRRKF